MIMEVLEMMGFPGCPECEKGTLLPFSFKEDVFEFWKCSICSHEIKKR